MRLGLDIGTNSIGWWLFQTDNAGNPVSTIDGGVRIFANGRDPKSKASLAVDRREARAARRRRDRFLRRRTVLMKRLADAGLMPADPDARKTLETLDPYEIRARGLREELSLNELGRAVFHLNQRRGFKSNRKTDKGDNEGGMIASGAAQLEQDIMASGALTYGDFLHKRRAGAVDKRKTPPVRTRMTTLTIDDKSKDGYYHYPTRALLEQEFDRLWEKQTEFHSTLTDELKSSLFETIFYQRPLKAPAIGRCLFEDEDRLPKAHPLFQRRILFETVNALRIRESGQRDRALTLEERDHLVLKLDGKSVKTSASANISFTALGKILKLTKAQTFSHETPNRKGIDCDRLRALLTNPDRLGARWGGLSLDEQWELVGKLRNEENPIELQEWLQTKFDLDDEHTLSVAKTPLPEGYGRIGLTATKAILQRLEAEVITYDKAASALYGDHRGGPTGEIFDELPYYGEILDKHVIPGTGEPSDDPITRYGRITNPTVHIGLNQLRRLLNQILKTYGKPDQIIVELARELKQNEKQKAEINKVIRKNTDSAIARGKKLEELGQRNTGANRLILRLWEELNPNDCIARQCVYSGQNISIGMLFDGSCDVDHILPYSRTLDDSIANSQQ